jgi:hypothetical protein
MNGREKKDLEAYKFHGPKEPTQPSVIIFNLRLVSYIDHSQLRMVRRSQ